MNKLTTFLEEEYRNFGVDYGGQTGFIEGAMFCCGGDYCDGHEPNMKQIKDHDTRLINKVLEMVEEEVKNQKRENENAKKRTGLTYFTAHDDGYNFAIDDITIILNKLKI